MVWVWHIERDGEVQQGLVACPGVQTQACLPEPAVKQSGSQKVSRQLKRAWIIVVVCCVIKGRHSDGRIKSC